MPAQEQAPIVQQPGPIPPKPVQQPPARRPNSSDEEEDESVARGVVQASVGVVVGMACTVIAQKTTGLISGPQKQQELTNADNICQECPTLQKEQETLNQQIKQLELEKQTASAHLKEKKSLEQQIKDQKIQFDKDLKQLKQNPETPLDELKRVIGKLRKVSAKELLDNFQAEIAEVRNSRIAADSILDLEVIAGQVIAIDARRNSDDSE